MTLRASKTIKDILTHVFLIIFSLLILFPVLWTIRTSFAPEVIAYEIPPRLIFQPTLEHYKDIFSVNHFEVFFRNSLIIALGATLLSVPIAAFGGYAFARYRVGGHPLQFIVIGTQMLPGIVLILPIFVIFTRVHLTNSLSGVILAYMAFNIPFLVWILMGFFEGVPVDIEEAAAIDGLSPLGILLRIVIPISTPGIMSSAILSFIMCWNEFLFALILTGSKTSTVPVGLAAMVTQRGVMIGKLSAGTAIAIIPMIIISIFVKKYLVHGLTLGAVK
jgi:multiple sugar transport system permease protein